MACCEYFCRDCKYEWFSNGSAECPRCESKNLYVCWDEENLGGEDESEHDSS